MKFSGLVIFSILILSCNQSDDKPIEDKISETDNNIPHQLIQDMTSKYDAEIYWFKNPYNSIFTYSIYLQEKLLGSNRRPILIYANITDVMKTKAGYKAIFSNFFNLPIRDLYFELILSKEQVDYILSPNGSIFDSFAIVADINEVVRANSQIQIEEGFGNDPSTAFIDVPGVFILKGMCLDILFIGEPWLAIEYLSNEELLEGIQ